MGIKIVPDLGAPLAVTAVDLALEKWAPTYSKWGTGILALGGYVAAYMNFGGDFAKNIGIAALPAFAKNIYDWATAGAVTAASKATRASSNAPRFVAKQAITRSYQPDFKSTTAW